VRKVKKRFTRDRGRQRQRERERGKKVLRYEKIDKGKAIIPMNEYKGIQN